MPRPSPVATVVSRWGRRFIGAPSTEPLMTVLTGVGIPGDISVRSGRHRGRGSGRGWSMMLIQSNAMRFLCGRRPRISSQSCGRSGDEVLVRSARRNLIAWAGASAGVELSRTRALTSTENRLYGHDPCREKPSPMKRASEAVLPSVMVAPTSLTPSAASDRRQC